jgi:hypothetical protein
MPPIENFFHIPVRKDYDYFLRGEASTLTNEVEPVFYHLIGLGEGPWLASCKLFQYPHQSYLQIRASCHIEYCTP